MSILRNFISGVRDSINRIAAIIAKEFVSTVKDKGSRAILVVPVLLQSALFGYGATFNLDRVPWALFNEGSSALTSEFVRRIENAPGFELKVNARSQTEFRDAINDSKALIGIWLPRDFADSGEAFLAVDARNSTTAGIAAGYVSSIVEKLNASRGTQAAVRVIDRQRFNENGLTRYAIMPGLILALSLIQVLLLAGLTVSREREDGTFDMMLMTPANSIEILIGKAVIPTIIACMQGFLIFCVGVFWFELPFTGSPLALGILIAGFAVSFVGLGLAVSAVAGNIQQAIVMIIFLMLPVIILSGLFTSTLAMPWWMQELSKINPLRYAIIALRMIYFEGCGLLETLHLFWPTAATATVTLGVASWLFRHRVT
ncbi:ABC transporter permease [Sutterella sp.]|uniref:ABC transporter permease n=1 Tax=Sutterella sp. TaxID=1981025 RepID=UPI0026E0EC7D|nr:ABC transporter permease [Sutterella sp.]MDO5531291.1 ABC transporter permease [Sutterella sp.]